MATAFRADQVGSFLRPIEVLEAHAARAEGRRTADQVREIEDAAILKLLDLQRASGIDVLSDGEYRRVHWSSGFADAVDGYVEGTPYVLQDAAVSEAAPEASSTEAGALQSIGEKLRRERRIRVIGQKLRQKRRITGYESGFLRQHANGRFKVTMPAVSHVVARAYDLEITGKVYGTRMDVLRDAAGIVQGEIKALIAEGVPYIQLDGPHYTDYVEESLRERWQAAGVDQQTALREDIEADNVCLRGLDRRNVTLAMHLCRGNPGQGPHAPIRYQRSGGYDWVAEQLFSTLEVDRFLLEYDSERAGTFSPLRFMPRGKMVVLGLITTKHGELESPDTIMRRIDEATRWVPIENLALSPQCGFASAEAGNPLTWDEQRRKLELVVNVARRIWSGPDRVRRAGGTIR